MMIIGATEFRLHRKPLLNHKNKIFVKFIFIKKLWESLIYLIYLLSNTQLVSILKDLRYNFAATSVIYNL